MPVRASLAHCAPDGGEDLLCGNQLHSAVLKFFDTPTELDIPSGLHVTVVGIEAGKQLLSQACPILRRQGLRLGRKFGNRVEHGEHQLVQAAVYARLREACAGEAQR